ncbi:MAG: class II glutamine amidotransferase [Bacteroidales bacterium]|nr:class II glutamine amidotransferase [Bacteroidales bacterium]
MCELLGLSGRKRIKVNPLLKEFYSHSEKHCHGWGLALFYGDAVSLEKEAAAAFQSQYLRGRISHDLYIDNMIAHIRLASVGRLFYENTHPFVKHDSSGRCWTLAHNGTLFSAPKLDIYKEHQEGQTDSERILYHIIDEVNKKQFELAHPLSPYERFTLLEELVADLSVGNKLNLLIWDGELMYVHSNYRGTLFTRPSDEGRIFATTPLDDEAWQPVPFLTLQCYREGEIFYQGKRVSQEYFDPEKDYEYKKIDYSNL